MGSYKNVTYHFDRVTFCLFTFTWLRYLGKSQKPVELELEEELELEVSEPL
jgi:hypothetical protein